jgi:hypothetical protein
MSSLDDVVRFAAQGPTLVVRWLPAVDFYTDTTPVFGVKSDGSILAWYPAFASHATGDRVRQVVQTAEGFRVDFDAAHDVSAIFRRPFNEAEKKQGFDWLAANANGGNAINMQASVDQALAALQTRNANPVRDKLFPVSYWSAYDFRIEKEVPAGIVIPTEDNRSLEWIALDGWEEKAEERNRFMSRDLDDPIRVLTELADHPGQNQSISYPEYVRAASVNDAAELALRKQWETLTALVGIPEEEQG